MVQINVTMSLFYKIAFSRGTHLQYLQIILFLCLWQNFYFNNFYSIK